MPTEDRIQYAFTAGEIAPQYFQRSDLTKSDIGLALCRNFFVDPRGGISSRAGSMIIGPVDAAGVTTKLYRFRGTDNDFLLQFGRLYMRVLQDGGYVVEGDLAVTNITQADPAVFTSTGHGLVDDDWVYFQSLTTATELNGRYFSVDNSTPNTFELRDPGYGLMDGTNITPGTTGIVNKVFTLVTPFTGEQLDTMSFEQDGNDVRLTHPDRDRRVLTFTSATSWAISGPVAASTLTKPTGVTLVSDGAASDIGIAVVVTAVDADGVESISSDYELIQDSFNYSAALGSLQITWTPVAGARSYNIYRSLLIPGTPEVTQGEAVGYIGSAFGAQFTDTNITPDFTKTPPVFIDPFAEGTILAIDVTAVGSGYSKTDTVSVSGGGGTGFDGFPIVSDSGTMIGISIVNGGSGYAAPIVVTITAGGTGATFDTTVGPATGTQPALFKVFQQRGVYFGTTNQPTDFWASRPKSFDNYDRGQVATPADPYNFSVDSVAVKPIKHAATLKNGLLIFNDDGVTQIRAETGKAVTGANALAEPQVYSGVSDTRPLVYNLDVIFLTKGATTVYAMLYTEYAQNFKLQDLSILAAHLLGPRQVITKFVSTQQPANLIYMPRSDGRELSLTYLREQEVFAWAQHETQGLIKDIEVIEENGVEVRYQLVERFLRGVWNTYIERVPPRLDDQPENYWGVDCGLAYLPADGTGEISGLAASGTTTLTVDSTAMTVGDIIYYAGGKFEVETIPGGTSVTGTWLRAADETLFQSDKNIPLVAQTGEWTFATPTSVVSGLWHLEGETVSVCADGNAFLDVVVADGQITLPALATKIYVGLAYECDFKTLPVVSNRANIAAKPKRIFSVFSRLLATRGMQFGADFDHLVAMKDRTTEAWGVELALRSDVSELLLDDVYTLDQFLVGRQKWPLPATVLGYTAEMDFGDT